MADPARCLRHFDRRAGQVHLAGDRIGHLDQHLALPQMRVLGGLRDGLDRRHRDFGGEQRRYDVIDRILLAPFGDRDLARVVLADAAGVALGLGIFVSGGDLHQPARHLAPRGGDHDMAVFRLVGGPPGFAALLAGREIIGERDLDHREAGIQQAAIDHLALAGAVAVPERRQSADRRVQRGVAVDQRGGGAKRAADRLPGQVHQPGHCLAERVESRTVAIGAVLPEAGDGYENDVLLQLAEAVVAEAHLLHDPGAEVLQHDVGGRHQGGENLLAALGAHVEAEAFLAAVVDREIDALAAHHRFGAAGFFATDLLDLDDLGAEIRQDHAAARARLVPRQFQDPHAFQTSDHFRPPEASRPRQRPYCLYPLPLANASSRSFHGGFSPTKVKVPRSAISRAAAMKAFNANREPLPPMLMRLTPASASSAAVIDGSAWVMTTLTGFDTDATTVRIVSRSLRPGA